MHGQHILGIDRQLICEEETFLWESRGELGADNESEMTAAQDHATKILQTEKDSKCRLCLQFDETVDHIISA
jgi:predicted alpha/beta superfamily hydrolase